MIVIDSSRVKIGTGSSKISTVFAAVKAIFNDTSMAAPRDVAAATPGVIAANVTVEYWHGPPSLVL
jgi:hypothetical protein